MCKESVNVSNWENQAFTLISGSYLLEINSKESDTDFIVILYFNYEGPVENCATSLLWLNFMGIQSECNFEQRKECSKNKLDSFYCTLCRVNFLKYRSQNNESKIAFGRLGTLK
ncbi:unnamed protein product [Meloidogyne enterolobii]|uniref:Uncharacterized protein n=1 Tax=Meloidogyne enterolobii TaxID=390850 RepID=A0ACB1ASK5_MELEN